MENSIFGVLVLFVSSLGVILLLKVLIVIRGDYELNHQGKLDSIDMDWNGQLNKLSISNVSFEDFYTQNSFDNLREYHLNRANKTLNKLLVYSNQRELIDIGIQGLRLIRNISVRHELQHIVEFSEEGKMLLATRLSSITKTKEGIPWPQLRDKLTGRFGEHAKIRPIDRISGKRVPKHNNSLEIDSLCANFVMICHIVSNIDIANNIGLINSKIDFLLTGRMLDRRAAIENQYYSIKDVLNSSLQNKQEALFQIHNILRENRIGLRLEVVETLNNVNSNKTWYEQVYDFVADINKSDKRVISALDKIEQHILLIEASLRLDSYLCNFAGFNQSLQYEKKSIYDLETLIKKKADCIDDARERVERINKYDSILQRLKRSYLVSEIEIIPASYQVLDEQVFDGSLDYRDKSTLPEQ